MNGILFTDNLSKNTSVLYSELTSNIEESVGEIGSKESPELVIFISESEKTWKQGSEEVE